MKSSRRPLPMLVPVLLVMLSSTAVYGRGAYAQSTQAAPAADGVTKVPPIEEKPDPLKRRLTDKERFKQRDELKRELHGVYKKWVDEDVHWIITDTELQAFKSLGNDEERDQFIEQFWL